MYFYLVAPNVMVRADESTFTYKSNVPLAIGTLVRVSVGKRMVNGVVMAAVKDEPRFPTKPIDTILAPHPLPQPLIELAKWMSEYYATHFATVLQTVLPTGLQKKRRENTKVTTQPLRKRTNIVLNTEQRKALSIMDKHKTGTLLLHGVTGAGKTQIYIEAAKHQARQGRSTLILVPEIALTPQLVAEFANHFTDLVVTHSRLTEAERHTAWLQVLQQGEDPLIVIGPRSALFMPISNLGLIVVDECHEPSYKQEQSPRYSALRAATMLARYHDEAKVILGSATPAITDYYLARSTKTPVLSLTQSAKALHKVTPEVIDLKDRSLFRRNRLISNALLTHIEEALADGKQTLIFHNRRGTAPSTLCEKCGWSAHCPHCFLPLTLHADHHQLRCHLCGFHQAVPPSCPECHEPSIIFKGIGTKLLETEIAKLFPKARIARFDADTHASEAVHERYQDLYDGNIDILIGTQMIAKGLDLPNLTVVGVVQADSGLILPDYQADERVFQLLYQVMGRVGRAEHPGFVIVQTYQPDHPTVKTALARDYTAFYMSELSRREAHKFPPFRFLLKLICSYKTEQGAVNASKKLASHIANRHPTVEVLGPTPAFYERLGGNYRWQLVVKSRNRGELVAIAKQAPPGWQADLDPASLL